MDRRFVFYNLSDFLVQSASDCLRLGFSFLLFNGEIYSVSKKAALIDELDDSCTMKVLDKPVLVRTGIFEKDLTGDAWAQGFKTQGT